MSCFAWLHNRPAGVERATFLVKARWEHRIISLAFLDGDPVLQKRVRDVAEEWLHAGIRMEFDWRATSADSHARISFGCGSFASPQ